MRDNRTHFFFSLAHEFKTPVSRLLSEMDANELNHWIAYFQIHPFTEALMIDATQMQSYITAASNSWSRKKFKVDDFRLKYGFEKKTGKVSDPRQQQLALFHMVLSRGGEVNVSNEWYKKMTGKDIPQALKDRMERQKAKKAQSR